MPPTAVPTPARRPAAAWRPLHLASLLLALLAAVAAAPAAVAGAPQAVDDSVVVDLSPGTRLVDVTANDSHPDGLAFRVVDVTDPVDESGAPAGSLVEHPDGSLSLVLAAAGPQRVSFTYALEDSTGTRSATATVCLGQCLGVIVAAANDLFTAEIGVPTPLDVLANDSGGDLTMLTWTQPEPQHGASLSWNATAEVFLYTAATLGDGEDHFSYTVEDAAGEPSTAEVSIALHAGGASSAEAVLVLGNCFGNPGPPTCYLSGDQSTGRVGPSTIDWGDGSPPESIPAHQLPWFGHDYPPGNHDYLATLTVYDDKGQPDSASLWVQAPDAPPTLGGPSYHDCTADLRCTLSAIVPADVDQWYWDFGPAIPPRTTPSPMLHAFAAPGSYPVALTVTDLAGQSITKSVVVQVPEVEPVLLGIEPDCHSNLYCVFVPVLEDPLAAALFHWDYGDGTGSSPLPPGTGTRHYARHGRYTVTVTAEGRDVTEDTFSQEIWIGEDHRLEVGATTVTPGVAKRIDLRNHFESPVVVVQPLAYPGAAPLVARFSEIASDHFTVVLEAAGTLPAGTVSLDYLVVDEGIWQLSDGSVVEAWRLPRAMPYEWPSDLDLAEVGRLKGELWFRAPFLHFFATPPVVLTQVQTIGEAGHVNTRQRRTTDHWVDLALEEPEADATPHAFETIGLVAVTPGVRTVEGFFDTDTPEAAFRLLAKGVAELTSAWATVPFNASFTSPPRVFSGTATHVETDSVTLRRASLSAASVNLRLHEDTTHDGETAHAAEAAHLFAVGSSGLLATTPLAPSSQAAPLAGPDHGETPAGRPVTVLALENDNDPEGEPLSIHYADHPQNGWVEIALYPLNRGVGLTWHPPPGFVGSDSFSYRVRDSAGLLSAPQTVTLEAVAADPGVLVERDFDDSTELAGFVTLAGSSTIEREELRFVADFGGTGGQVLWQGGGLWTDYRLVVDLLCQETTAKDPAVGVTLHHLDDDNQIRLTWSAATGQWQVEQISEGALTLLATADDYLVRDEFSQLTVDVDDGLLRWTSRIVGYEYLVPPPVHEVAIGGLGLGSFSLLGEGCGRFDNLLVTDLETNP